MRARPRAEPSRHPDSPPDAEAVLWCAIFSRYAGSPPFNRLCGGQIAAESLLAAADTVDPDNAAHSLHTSFFRAGDGARVVTYRVDRVRDSRSVSTRIVTAEQAGRLLATAVASFRTPPSADAPPPVEHEWPPEHTARVRPARHETDVDEGAVTGRSQPPKHRSDAVMVGLELLAVELSGHIPR